MRTQQKHRQGVWLDKALPDPAVSARSKSTDHVDLRILGNCIARIPRNTTPTLVETSDDTRDPRLSAAAESATSPHHPPATSRSSFPPQLSPFSDSHIAPGYHPSGPLSSFGKNEISLRGDGSVRLVKKSERHFRSAASPGSSGFGVGAVLDSLPRIHRWFVKSAGWASTGFSQVRVRERLFWRTLASSRSASEFPAPFKYQPFRCHAP